jgi:hypothetical protein
MKKEHYFMIAALVVGGLGGFMFAKHKYEAKTGTLSSTTPVVAPVTAPVTAPVIAPVVAPAATT